MGKGKKVLLDLERMRYPNSGIANVFRNLAIGLNEIEKPINLEVSLFGPKNTLESIKTNFSIVNRKAFHKFFPFYSTKFDLLHTSHQLSAFFHSKKRGQKKIVTLHDLNFLHENLSAKKRDKMLSKVKNNIENADVIVCISDFTKRNLLQNKSLFNYESTPEIIVIHNGMQFPVLKMFPLENFNFLEGKKYILNIGVLFPKKNQLLLVKMLPFIEDDLVLVASGEKEQYKNEILAEIERLGVKDRVHFLSNISENEKWSLIQNCVSMCHPSLAEGFGIPPIEAMYMGKPVFISDKTSLPEIGGSCANYFRSFETEEMIGVYKKGMEFYQSNKESASKDLKNRALSFDYLAMAKKYAEVYDKLGEKVN